MIQELTFLRINKTRRVRLEMRPSWRTFLCFASTHEHCLSTSICLDTRFRENGGAKAGSIFLHGELKLKFRIQRRLWV